VTPADRGFAVVDIGPVSARVLATYRDCPLWMRSDGLTYHRRSVQLRISWTADDDWHTEVTAADRRAGMEVGAVVLRGLRSVWLDLTADWRIDVDQVRTRVAARARGPVGVVPVWARRRELLMLAVLDRDGAEGGGVTLCHADGATPAWHGVLRPGQALVVRDRGLLPALHELTGPDDRAGHVDMVVGALSRWAHPTTTFDDPDSSEPMVSAGHWNGNSAARQDRVSGHPAY
jgi:hypothetical protein